MNTLMRFCLLSALVFGFALPVRAQGMEDLAQGVDFYNKQRYPEAMAYLNRSAGQGNVRAFYYMALCHQRQGNNDLAVQLFEHIKQTFPRSVEARYADQFLTGVPVEKKSEGRLQAAAKASKVAPEKPKPMLLDAQGKALPMEARIPFQKKQGHMYVKAKINGKYKDIVFDTGATTCSISITDFPDLFTQEEYQNAPSVGVMRPDGMTTNKSVEGEISIDTITRRCRILLTLEPGVSVIGQNFFKDYSYEVDDFYVRLSRGKQSTPVVAAAAAPGKASGAQKDKFTIPFVKDADCMMVDLMLNGKKVETVFDTGCAPDGVVMPRWRAEELKVSRNSDGYFFDSVELGPISKRFVKVYFIEGSVVLIGPHFFGDRRYSVDQVNNVIRFQY